MTTLKSSGSKEVFSTGSQRDNRFGKGRYDLLPMHAIERLAKVYEAGAEKYGDNNWRKGQPQSRLLDSAMRHLCKFAEGHRDEDHSAMAIWNIAAIIEVEVMAERGLLDKGLLDLPNYVAKQSPVGEKSDGVRRFKHDEGDLGVWATDGSESWWEKHGDASVFILREAIEWVRDEGWYEIDANGNRIPTPELEAR